MNRSGVGACVAVFLGASAAGADELSGDILLGWRDVSVGGSVNKYRQHVNLSDGGRLFGLRLDYEREQPLELIPDRINVDLRNLGGDPFENIHIGVRKFGSYNFRYDRRKSEYFYNDLLIDPLDASIDGSTGGDFHHFDFDRVQESISLNARLTPRASADLRFDRYTREGTSTTTRDIQRDEFELEQPIDEENQVVTLGIQYRWDKLTLAVEQRYREFDSLTEVFLAGFSQGENPGDLTTLDFYFFDQPYGYDSNETQVSLTGRPTDRFDWRFSTSIVDLDLDVRASERAMGIDFMGNPFTVDESGVGKINREVGFYDFESSFVVTDAISMVAAARQQRLDQDGSLAIGSDGGRSDWKIDTTGVELGLQFVVSPELTIVAGWSAENRETDVTQEAESATSAINSDTDRNGFYATLRYRPSDRLDVNARVESNRIDDPFTLASPTDTLRYRLRGRYRFANGVMIAASHKINDLDNDNTGWTARNEQTDIRLTYDTERLQLSAGASVIDLERDFEQLVTGGFRQDLFAVAYRGDTTFVDGRIVYRATDTITIGAGLRNYDNNGSFPSERRDADLFIEYGLPKNYRVRLSYQNVDYDEDLEDYDADIVEIAFGLGW